MPQFDVSSFSSQLFWLIIVFGFLYFLISRFIAPKAESILTQRNGFLEENISHAEEYNNRAKSIEAMREGKLEEVNSHVEDLHKQALEMMESHFAHQKQELSVVLDKKKEKALAQIQNYIDKFHVTEPDSCIKLAAFIIQKVTNKDADIELLKKIHGKIQ
jgi:F-type H+-transporting ATPase subunit b